jgi:hypothetical protein
MLDRAAGGGVVRNIFTREQFAPARAEGDVENIAVPLANPFIAAKKLQII